MLRTIQLGSISSLRCQKSRTSLPIQASGCEVMFRGRRLNQDLGDQTIWWSQTGSNRRPHACKARALPAELWPRNQKTKRLSKARRRLAAMPDTLRIVLRGTATRSQRRSVVGLGRLELPTSRLSSARSNQLSYKPLTHIPSRTRDTASRRPSACSSAKKEKRRRRNPANGAQRSGDLLAPDVSKTIR